MDITKALLILNVTDRHDKSQLKKRYRELMRLVHPDNGADAEGRYDYTAQEINEAYSFLNSFGDSTDNRLRKTNQRHKENQIKNWDAPTNKHALFKRKIYDEVHDADGSVIGFYEIDEDKYLWTKDEEFHLFLKSIFTLSKQILEDTDGKLKREQHPKMSVYQAELIYLLAGQFIDSIRALYELNLDIEDEADEVVFYIPAMLEMSENVKLNGDIFPMGVSRHRLYVCDKDRNNLGYISFKDDRYSFILTPLFEQKSVKVKMELEKNKSDKNSKRSAKNVSYRNVDLWLKVPAKQPKTYVDSINLKIAELISRYEKEG